MGYFSTSQTSFFLQMKQYANLVDSKKCLNISIYLQHSALVQPRTSPAKSGLACLPACLIPLGSTEHQGILAMGEVGYGQREPED